MPGQNHILVCCDFDGTVILEDVGSLLASLYLGKDRYDDLGRKAATGEVSLREIAVEQWGCIKFSQDEAYDLIKDFHLDQGFESFAEYCFEEDIPVVIVSGGMRDMISHLIKRFFPSRDDKFRIISNSGQISTEGWVIEFQDDSDFGHDKGQTIKMLQKEYIELHGVKPFTIFCGDGVSDLSAANHANWIFARRGYSLEEHCKQHNIPYFPFDDFQTITGMTI